MPKWAKRAFASSLVAAGTLASTSQAQEIVHDAEHYILESQNGKKWAVEDGKLEKKLAALKKKYGQPPNIVYILWDDQQIGAVVESQLGERLSMAGISSWGDAKAVMDDWAKRLKKRLDDAHGY